MAYVMPLAAPITAFGITLDRAYNVDFDVGGQHSSGLRADVQLVQALLNIRFSTEHNVRCVKTGRILTSLNVDGICGPATANAILSYQTYIAAGPNGTKVQRVDGIISRANPTGISTISHTGYTIIRLNIHLAIVGNGQLLDPGIFPVEPLNSELNQSMNNQGVN